MTKKSWQVLNDDEKLWRTSWNKSECKLLVAQDQAKVMCYQT